jgi:hypothetical protein
MLMAKRSALALEALLIERLPKLSARRAAITASTVRTEGTWWAD